MIYILSTIRKSPLFQVLLRPTFMLCMCIFRDSAFGLSLMIHLIFFLPRWSPHLFFTFVFRFQVSKSLWSGFKHFLTFFLGFCEYFIFLGICIFVQRCLPSATSTAEERIFVWRFLVFRSLSGFRFQQICISVQLLRRPRRGCCCRKPLRGEIFLERFLVFKFFLKFFEVLFFFSFFKIASPCKKRRLSSATSLGRGCCCLSETRRATEGGNY